MNASRGRDMTSPVCMLMTSSWRTPGSLRDLGGHATEGNQWFPSVTSFPSPSFWRTPEPIVNFEHRRDSGSHCGWSKTTPLTYRVSGCIRLEREVPAEVLELLHHLGTELLRDLLRGLGNATDVVE